MEQRNLELLFAKDLAVAREVQYFGSEAMRVAFGWLWQMGKEGCKR